MGSYPSAALLYGIDLGIYGEEDWEWFTPELEEEHGGPEEVLSHLLSGVDGVSQDTYGNFNSGYQGVALCTKALFAHAYEAEVLAENHLSVDPEDTERLREAWEILYPGEKMPSPKWFIVVSYG
jgi:hypothetical protein